MEEAKCRECALVSIQPGGTRATDTCFLLGHNCPLKAEWAWGPGASRHRKLLSQPPGLRLAGGLLGSTGDGAGHGAAHESLSGAGGLGQRWAEMRCLCFGAAG